MLGLQQRNQSAGNVGPWPTFFIVRPPLTSCLSSMFTRNPSDCLAVGFRLGLQRRFATMKSDLYSAIAQIAGERGIPKEAVLSSVEHALKTVYKKMENTEEDVDVTIDANTGLIQVYLIKHVVDEVEDPLNDVLLPEAVNYLPTAKVGDTLRIERTPENFGRIAAQTAKQVVLQRIRDYERDTVYEEFADRQGEDLNGVVQRADPRAVIVELGKAEAVMPAREQVPTERYRPGQRVKVLLVEVNKDQRGPQLIVSRSHPGLIRRLFEQEVPEIYSGAVAIMDVA